MTKTHFGHSLLALLLSVTTSSAEVVRVEIDSREPFAEEMAGKAGSYELIRGRVFYAVDPSDDSNKQIVDLELAPTNSDGLVEFWADLEIINPIDLRHAQPTLNYTVNNRGWSWASQPDTASFNMSRGIRHGVIGWIAQVPAEA